MDFIAGLANMRARNYSIREVDKLKAKFIAARIVPAIATSAALTTGLVCLELYKRPLKTIATRFGDVYIPRGISVSALDKDTLWVFQPKKLGEGDLLTGGDLYADTVLELEFQGVKQHFTMLQTWPLRTPRPVASKLAADTPLLTGQRVLDALFPSLVCGTCAIHSVVGKLSFVKLFHRGPWKLLPQDLGMSISLVVFLYQLLTKIHSWSSSLKN